MSALVRRFGRGLAGLIVGLSLFWVLAMVVLPEIVMIDFAFRPNLLPAAIGGPKDVYTLDTFRPLADNPIHRATFFKPNWANAFLPLVPPFRLYPYAYSLPPG